ncbi:MAG: FtsX-like permease family protein [Candidatus Saccharimonadales bacterium]
MRNVLRSPVKSGAIVLMLAMSIALILVMLAARASVTTKISEVKAATASEITISPAGIQGGMGGGDPLTADQVTAITQTAHVTHVVSTLTDQLSTDDTNLTPSFELGSFGQRQQRFENSSGSNTMMTPPMPASDSSSSDNTTTERRMPQPRTTITGTTDPNSVASNGGTLTFASGSTIDGDSDALVALVGSNLASKNNLSVGSTFTAYDATITVKGIFKTDSEFTNNGIIMPLLTVQALTDQAGQILSATVTVDSSENVASTVAALKTTLGTKADVTSQAERTETSLAPLNSISNLTLSGVIGATIAGAVIIFLSMIMIVRERRREIGVIKAIGGTNTKVITQFIVEAMTLTLAGAVVGIALGIVMSGPLTTALVSSTETTTMSSRSQERGPRTTGGPMMIPGGGAPFGELQTNVESITSTLSPSVFASAAAITIAITIIGSAVPAWLIARVRPAEVLRTE